jgi:hypothetical protein
MSVVERIELAKPDAVEHEKRFLRFALAHDLDCTLHYVRRFAL